MTLTVAETLESLRDADGLLRIETVVEAAADPTSILHAFFEWRDDEAAHRFRLGQARALIRAQKIAYRLGPIILRSVSYVPKPGEVGAYQRMADIEQGSDGAKAVMLAELSRVSGALGRARAIGEILGVSAELDDLLHALAGLNDRVANMKTPKEDA